MKKLIFIFYLFVLSFKLFGQGTITATYSTSDIPTNFHASNFDDACNGPLSNLILILPAGTSYTVSNVKVEYTMEAISPGYKSDQVSVIKFQNTNVQEATEAVGVGNTAGLQTYSRNITIANGTYPGGTALKFQMRARRTYEGTPGCNTLVNRVNKNTWKITVTYADAGKTGINNTDPQVALDIKGGLRLRPAYIPVVNNVLNIPDNASNITIEQGGSGIFTANINNVVEGQVLIFDNLYGFVGSLPGGADIPLGVSQFIFSDGEWKQNPTPNTSSSPTGGWALTGNGGTSSPTNYIGTNDQQPLSFKTNNMERMVLSKNKSYLKLNTNNFTDSSRISFYHQLGADYVDYQINTIFDGANTGLNFSSKSNDIFATRKNIMHMNLLDGNIGIGTKTPDGKLTIHSKSLANNFPAISIRDSSLDNTNGGILEFKNITGTQYFNIKGMLGSTPATSHLQFTNNGIHLMRLRGDGNLGIGTGSLDPNLAPLLVGKKVGNVHAIFGDNTTGVAIESAFPGIHFNSYYNGSRKTMITGYTSGMEMDPTSGSINFYTSPASTVGGNTASVFSRMVVDRNGNVGINKAVPSQKLDVGGVTKSTSFLVSETGNSITGMNIGLTGTDNIGLFANASKAVWVAGSGADGVGLYASSTVTGFGIHSIGRVKFDNHVIVNDATITMNKGTIQTIEITPNETATTGAAINLRNAAGITTIKLDADFNDGDGRVITSELQINGGSDLSENFDVIDEEVKPGMIVSIDEQNEGKLQICNLAKDKKIVGIISGANGIRPGMIMGQKESIADGEYPVALAGRVYVLTDNVEIKAGDFLTSSSRKGYATKVDDISKCQGAIIGKAMGKRDPITGMTLVLINLQ